MKVKVFRSKRSWALTVFEKWFSSAEIMSQMENLNNDENSTFHKIQKQNLILLPETHTIYYKELHTVMGLE